MKRRYQGLLFVASLSAASLTLASVMAPARAAMLPDSERLDPVRPALERTVDQVTRDGLPSDLIVSKVREGLAKGASPEAIRAAVERLARSLGDADQFLRVHRKKAASTTLVRALAEARTAGIDLEVAASMVESDASDGALVHAVEALTDLTMRGYPSHRAAFVIRDVLARDPGAMGHVVAGVETIRVGQAVSRVDALEALGRAMVSTGGSFEAALGRAIDGVARKGGGMGMVAGVGAKK